MKVLQVIASHGMGGLEKHTIELCEGLSMKGIEVHLLAPKDLCKLIINPNIKVHHFDFSRSRYNPKQLFKAYKYIRNINPDIIHYQANKAAQIGGLINKFLHIPKVCTIHNLKKNLNFLKSFKSAIAVSRNVSKHFPETTSPIVIYNGIQKLAPLNRANSVGNQGDATRWISVGRLVDAKGFDVLLKAFQKVPGTLQIVGDGPRKNELLKLCSEYELDDRVQFLGQRNDVIELLKASDICVVSSRNEGFSYVIAEALIHQIPVISTNVPVANEFFSDEKICAVGDVKALTELMCRAADNNLDYSSEFAFASENFTIEAMVNKTIDHYKRLIELK